MGLGEFAEYNGDCSLKAAKTTQRKFEDMIGKLGKVEVCKTLSQL